MKLHDMYKLYAKPKESQPNLDCRAAIGKVVVDSWSVDWINSSLHTTQQVSPQLFKPAKQDSLLLTVDNVAPST